MRGYRSIVSQYGNAPFAASPYRFEESKFRSRNSSRCDTFPLFTGGLRGSFRFSIFRTSQAQRLSSTAVYPPCPRTVRENWDACNTGHGGYTATGYAPFGLHKNGMYGVYKVRKQNWQQALEIPNMKNK